MLPTYQKPTVFTKRDEAPHNATVIEAFENALTELFFIDHPNLKKTMPEAEKPLKEFLADPQFPEIWIYYPWLNTLIHTVPEDVYLKLRTARNRNIILESEQKNYREAHVGIAGLSVGSAVLSALAISGGPKTIKIADFDTVEITNLNRIRATLPDIGKNKTWVAAREIWEIDPFAELSIWDTGITRETINDFITGTPRLDIFVDEMDSLDIKILARLICKKEGIPVVMATDNGDSVILDVERFDQEPNRAIFHGLVGEMRATDVENLSYKDWLQLATKIVGAEYLTERMQDSLVEIGHAISAVPQLGTTAAIAGSSVAYVIRRIANRQEMPSGRYQIGLEEKLIHGYTNTDEIAKRQEKTQQFIKNFGKNK